MICPSCESPYLDSKGMVIRLDDAGEWPVGVATRKLLKTEDDVIEVVTPHESTMEDKKIALDPEKPSFGPDGKADCPYCDKRLTKSWYKRHIKKEHPDK